MLRLTRFAALLAAAAAFLAEAPTAGAAAPLPKLAVEPLAETAEVESHVEALLRWSGRGLAGATLVHVDVIPRVRRLGPRQAEALAGVRAKLTSGEPAAALQALREVEDLEFTFTRAAVRLGLAAEVIWVVPVGDFQRSDAEAHLRDDLQRVGFGRDELGTFAMDAGCFRGKVEGAPFAVCVPERLPRAAGPALLNLNMAFVFSAAAARPSPPLTEMRGLLGALAAAAYPAAGAVVHASTMAPANPPLDPGLRWVGEATAQALRDPALLARPEEVRRWSSLRRLTLLAAAGASGDLLHETLPLLTVHDDDPALHLFAAKALAGLRRLDESESHAASACRLHPAYCLGLPWIALDLLDQGDVDGAERFFAAGERLRPGMTFGQVVRGVQLARAGRLDAALAVFDALVKAGAPFPAAFMAGSIALGRDDLAAARRFFDLGVAALRPDQVAVVEDRTAAGAVRDAISFYRHEGPAERADLLAGGTLIWLPPDDEAPAAPAAAPPAAAPAPEAPRP